jgi:hypothetical protein
MSSCYASFTMNETLHVPSTAPGSAMGSKLILDLLCSRKQAGWSDLAVDAEEVSNGITYESRLEGR